MSKFVFPNICNGELPDWVTSEEERLKSFKYWAYKDGPCCPVKMAEAGFFTSGKKNESEFARCYVCLKELDGWEEDDDPWTEHIKHSPDCMFVKLRKTPSDLTVEDTLRLEVERQKNFLIKRYEANKKELLTVKNTIQEEVNRLSIIEDKKNRGPKTGGSTNKRSSRRK